MNQGRLLKPARVARGRRCCAFGVRPRKEGWLPDATMDGIALDFDQWPASLSPYLTSRDRVLDVNDGRSGFTIDWRQDLPVYSYYDLAATGRHWTKREHIVGGKLVTESLEASAKP